MAQKTYDHSVWCASSLVPNIDRNLYFEKKWGCPFLHRQATFITIYLCRVLINNNPKRFFVSKKLLLLRFGEIDIARGGYLKIQGPILLHYTNTNHQLSSWTVLNIVCTAESQIIISWLNVVDARLKIRCISLCLVCDLFLLFSFQYWFVTFKHVRLGVWS